MALDSDWAVDRIDLEVPVKVKLFDLVAGLGKLAFPIRAVGACEASGLVFLVESRRKCSPVTLWNVEVRVSRVELAKTVEGIDSSNFVAEEVEVEASFAMRGDFAKLSVLLDSRLVKATELYDALAVWVDVD